MTDDFLPVRIDGDAVTLVFACVGQNIDLVYLGRRLPDDENLAALTSAGQQGGHENQPDLPPITGLLPQNRGGYTGRAAFYMQQQGRPIDPDFHLTAMTGGGSSAAFTWTDQITGLLVDQDWTISVNDIIRVTTSIQPAKDDDILVTHATTAVLPLSGRMDQLSSFPGRWAREAQQTDSKISQQATILESRAGKPGFAGGNWIILSDSMAGDCVGIHTASFGDHHIEIQKDAANRTAVSAAAFLQPDGIKLAADKITDLGKVEFCYAPDTDRLSQQFQRYIRNEIMPGRADWGDRKVHINSWEALGFELEEEALKTLASDAAKLGVERFVLDDGWFLGRRSDKSALGDWIVDPDIFPEGLAPLINHVQSLDMDFGLWVEPEMVSQNSALYREHPDWCLQDAMGQLPTERNQLVLDLSDDEARSHILDAMDRLLRGNDIAYLKWDHNRRLFPDNGMQQLAIQAMLEHMREKWPDVEIEICSSGGGRVSTRYLEYCHRIWPSDNNDPIERVRIMQSWSHFLPLEIMGNHIGPSPNPITGRHIDMDFRSKIALFGHMGVEANPADMSADERTIAQEHIAHYKQWRTILHRGMHWKLVHPDDGIFAQMVVDGDKAIAIAAQTAFSENFDAVPLQLKGLAADGYYRVTLPKPWPQLGRKYLANQDQWLNGMTLSGQFLMQQGLAIPLTHPETAWIVTLERISL